MGNRICDNYLHSILAPHSTSFKHRTTLSQETMNMSFTEMLLNSVEYEAEDSSSDSSNEDWELMWTEEEVTPARTLGLAGKPQWRSSFRPSLQSIDEFTTYA